MILLIHKKTNVLQKNHETAFVVKMSAKVVFFVEGWKKAMLRHVWSPDPFGTGTLVYYISRSFGYQNIDDRHRNEGQQYASITCSVLHGIAWC